MVLRGAERPGEGLTSTEVFTVGRNDIASAADEMMEAHRIRHLPVLGEDGELAGIPSRRDVFRTALKRTLGRLHHLAARPQG